MGTAASSSATTVWDRVVGAIDVTPASIQAARTAAGLMPPAATLTLCAVVGHKAPEPTAVVDQALTREAQEWLDQAQAEIQPVRDAELHLREGPPIGRLLDELHAERATVVTVGRPEHTRAAVIGLGSVTTAMLQEAPSSVLIADASERADGELVVGYDGSGGARRALAAGRELSERLSLTLRVIVATGDAHPPGPGWSREELGSELLVAEDARSALEALIDGSRSARLLILGSRHLRGVMALASVSENAALRARCPVLVVR
jgi:nucleotide-binding universal stress UspA family protein